MKDTLDKLFRRHLVVTPQEVAVAFKVSKLTIRRRMKRFTVLPIARNTYRLTREQVRRLFPEQ